MFTVSPFQGVLLPGDSAFRWRSDMDNFASLVFSISSLVVMPFWLLMLVAPRWRWTARLLGSPAVVGGAIALYAALVVPQLGRLLPVVARPQLPVLAALLGEARGATIAWTHF